MKQDQRTPISRDGLLAKYLRSERLGYFSFVPLLTLGLISLIVTAVTMSRWAGGSTVYRVCIAILLATLWSATLVPTGFMIIPTLVKRHYLKKGCFSLEEDEVVGMAEESDGKHTVKVLYFQKYGRAAAGSTLWGMVSEGDTLYVAVLHGKKDEILGVYHPLMYRRTDGR